MSSPLTPRDYERLGLNPLTEKQREAFCGHIDRHPPSCPRCGQHKDWEGGIPAARIADLDFGQGVKPHPPTRRVIFLCRSCDIMSSVPLQADFATVGMRYEFAAGC
jgi:hypothetical protein